MVGKGHKPAELLAKLRQVDVMGAQGAPLAEAIGSIGVAERAFHRWRNEFGGSNPDQVRCRKKLGQENARLRRAVPDLTLGERISAVAARGA